MKRRGFTLIEFLITITIIMLISGFFIANYNGYNSAQTVRQAAADLIANLESARTSASAGVKPGGCDTLVGYTVTFSDDLKTYTSRPTCRNNVPAPFTSHTLPSDVTFSTRPGSILFYPLNQGSSVAEIITVSGAGGTQRVSVSTSGVITIL